MSPRYTVSEPARHSLHECRTAEDFAARFALAAGVSVQDVANEVVAPTEPRAIFLVGSLPLGMGTSGSDLDFIVLVDSRTALFAKQTVTNTQQQLAFSNKSDPLLAGEFVTLPNGILTDVQVAIAPAIVATCNRLRERGPELGESEIRTLGRLRSGWLLWQSDEYLGSRSLNLADPAFEVYCCTKHFVAALINRRKALAALDFDDIALAMQLGRSSLELAYLAYFASEGQCYLGAKWLAQLGHAHGAAERLSREPVLTAGVKLLFPALAGDTGVARQYLQSVSEFLMTLRRLIERRMLLRIAFGACPQIYPV